MSFPYIHPVARTLQYLLDLHGVDTNSNTILTALEAPYLFLLRDGCYLAGTAFLNPAWMNLYLQPLGMHLTDHQLPRKNLRTFLSAHPRSLLLLPEEKALVIQHFDGRQVELAEQSNAPGYRISFPALMRKLPASLMLFTLNPCPPLPTDMIPLLCESVRTIAEYRRELKEHLSRTVTRQEMKALHQQLFRALMVDLPSISHLYDDSDITTAFHELAHHYRHLFIIGENEILLQDRLPIGYINRCTTWLQELILDRLHELGASDQLLDTLYPEIRLKP